MPPSLWLDYRSNLVVLFTNYSRRLQHFSRESNTEKNAIVTPRRTVFNRRGHRIGFVISGNHQRSLCGEVSGDELEWVPTAPR
jgi:hypothetical protein